MTRISHDTARLMLAKARPNTSLLEAEFLANEPDFVFDKSDWVPLYYDTQHAFASDCGTITAYRAHTLKGDWMWFVFREGKARGYHAACDDPQQAITMAKASWAGRRAVRADWDRVEQTARDLLLGRQRFDVRVEDLEASPLCDLGICGFRSAIRMDNVTRIPGWVAALLMKVEPQMGFVIHAAMERHAATKQIDLAVQAA